MPKPTAGERFAADELQQPVVAPATANRAHLARAVEELEDDACVVGEPPHHREVEAKVATESHGLQDLPVLCQGLHGGQHRVARPEPVAQAFPRAIGHQIGERTGRRVPDPQRLQPGARLRRPGAARFVDHREACRSAALRHPELVEDGVHQTPVVHPRDKVLFPQPQRPHPVDRDRRDLGVRTDPRLAHDVGVELEVLPQPAPLAALVAEELRDREPANRLGHPPAALRQDPRERRGHLGAQRDLAPTLVREGVELLDDLGAALLDVQPEWLQRWPVVLHESVPSADAAPGVENAGAESEIRGYEIPKTGELREGLV